MVFYCVLGVTIATVTSGLPAFWHVTQWWNQPIVYQKLVLWTVLLEVLGLAGSWGPLAGHFKPMTGGIRYWARPGTIRLPPWPDGCRSPRAIARTSFDVALYVALLVSLVVALVAAGRVDVGHVGGAAGQHHGLVGPCSCSSRSCC